MDDDITWGSSVWASSEPVVSELATKPRPPGIRVPSPPTPYDPNANFDDFDDFTEPTEGVQDGGLKDDDFGDFEEFEEGTEAQPVSSFADVSAFSQPGPSSQRSWQPLHVDPSVSRHELKDKINDILAPVWAGEDIARLTTDDPMREVEGIGQILITPSSRDMYKALSQTAPTKPPNWTRSRIRRQHLISLGIPVNLDEVLPKSMAKPLPRLEIHTRPTSAPPGARHGGSNQGSRSGTPQPGPRNTITAQFGAKPEVNTARISSLLDANEQWLQMQPLPNLERLLSELKMQTGSVSSLLTYLLQSRDALQQDSETYNGLIGELVSEVSQKVQSGKPSLTRTMSSRRS